MNSKDNSLADTARQLLQKQKVCSLATHSVKHPGFPHNSIVPYAISSGRPVFFMSSMATHTKNLLANGKASMLVAADSSNPQSTGRITLIGNLQKISDSDSESAKSDYLAAQPEAKQWAGFGDFAMFEFQPIEAYVVAGFGAMGWVASEDLY